DVVLGHVLGAGGQNCGAQARVHVRIRHAELRRDRDLAGELGEQPGARRILAHLAMHDVLELGMSGHGSSVIDDHSANGPSSAIRDRMITGIYRTADWRNSSKLRPERRSRLLEPARDRLRGQIWTAPSCAEPQARGDYLPSFQISAASFQSPPTFSQTTTYL